MKNPFKRFSPPGRRKAKKEPEFTVRKWDPLYIIFEKHLYDFNYESRLRFVTGVIEEYLTHLAKQKVLVPAAWRPVLEKNLSEEISDMLVRKLYGCLTVEEFREKEEAKIETIVERKEVRKRYQKLVG